nr:MAG TPA: hypothetical protein [Caudoviricetes sp.]
MAKAAAFIMRLWQENSHRSFINQKSGSRSEL